MVGGVPHGHGNVKWFATEVEVAELQAVLRYTAPVAPSSQESGEEAVLPVVPSGGAGGTRTPCLRLAKAALSQMSYSPTFVIRAQGASQEKSGPLWPPGARGDGLPGAGRPVS